MDKQRFIAFSALFASFFALCVIGLGAFTRLIDAGLGCPDWPGCYGHLIPTQYSDSHLVMYKAWAEMIHRYFVGALSLLILMIITFIFIRPRKNIFFAVILILLLLYQILLGQWTVTLKLLPIIVTQHLIGGFLILSVLWMIYLSFKSTQPRRKSIWLAGALVAIILLLTQIFFGAWTSTNYASLSCPGFPFCMNDQSLQLNLQSAFTFFSPLGINYEGGVLSESARQTIHMMHRTFALIFSSYLLIFLFFCYKKFKNYPDIMQQMMLILGLVILQISLGISNIIFQLPLITAIAHTLCAALLLIAMISFIDKLSKVFA